ncbi:RES domain-containing protein [Myroides sp. 1354]|uniref:HEPN-associated N-terminal domain-containing protein n=1 Tax=unclassified Myroides TaxID=2642485 RepID=UPI0025755601|nr:MULTISPECIES: HEPN-associated N-terminal domain-containing protein [unclassified Myroides]MDM1044359.1 RES domain-containing protein [Myroides sp. R163-1]MDM1056234.1 RES domain-containing protein [Myroides sp. 1354]MDM1069410.1 RES domain-containing protein [Myroides sp. 1372]
MSIVMEEALRLEELGLNNIPEKYLCNQHLNDKGIKKYINLNANLGYCDYCNRNKKVISLEELMEFFITVINSHSYTDPANFMTYNSREGGYIGEIYTTNEILEDHLGLNIDDYDLSSDISSSIDYSKCWAEYNLYHETPHETMLYSWQYFKEVVNNRSRYFFGQINDLNSDDYLMNSNQIFKEISRAVKSFKLIKRLPIKTTFYRCRQHMKEDKTVLTSEGMTSPPDEYAIYANRMSPAGISMFYGAFEEETTLLEVIDINDKKNSFYTTVEFISKKELNVIDFTALPKPTSPFDLKSLNNRFLIQFIRDFIEDFSAPIEKDNRTHINYVPTQIVTEYFRFPFSNRLKEENKIDGIIYHSSKNKKKACVLFLNNKESLKVLHMKSDTLKTQKITKKRKP